MQTGKVVAVLATGGLVAAIGSTAMRRLRVCLSLAMALCLTGCISRNLSGGGGLDFALSVSPGSQAVTAGGGANYLIMVNQTAGLGPVVQLSVSGLPARAVAQFADGPLTGAGTVSLSVLTSSATPPGTSQLTISGSDPSGTQKTTVMLTVNPPPPPPGFSLTASPGRQATLAGGSVSYTVDVIAPASHTVNLSISNVPGGATASFDQTSVIGGSTATLTVDTTTSLPDGSYDLTINGADSSGTQNIDVILEVASTDFSLSSDLGAVTITAGGVLTGTLTVTPVVGSPGPVELSLVGTAPSGIVVSFDPSVVPDGAGSSTITINVDASVAPGDYQLEIQASDSRGIQSLMISLTVEPGDPVPGFFLAVSPTDQTVNAGDTASYTLNVLTNGGPVPSVSIDVGGLPDGASSQITQDSPDTFVIEIFTDPNGISSGSTITFTVTGPGGSQSITVTLEVDSSS